MLPIKSFLPPNSMESQNLCNLCNSAMLNSATCCFCGKRVCRNKCSYLILPQFAQNKPWLSNKVGQNVCLNCMPKTSTASDNYIRKVFAEIFSPSDEIEYENKDRINNIVEDQQSTIQDQISYPEDQSDLLDKLIGGVLYNLAIDNNLKFTPDGNLSEESIKDIKNSFEGYLYSTKLI